MENTFIYKNVEYIVLPNRTKQTVQPIDVIDKTVKHVVIYGKFIYNNVTYRLDESGARCWPFECCENLESIVIKSELYNNINGCVYYFDKQWNKIYGCLVGIPQKWPHEKLILPENCQYIHLPCLLLNKTIKKISNVKEGYPLFNDNRKNHQTFHSDLSETNIKTIQYDNGITLIRAANNTWKIL